MLLFFNAFIEDHYGILLLTISVLFFTLLRICVSYLPIPVNISSKNDEEKLFEWYNLIISWCHAAIVGTWSLFWYVIFSIASYFADMWTDLVFYSNGPMFCLCCFTTGYFIYDMIDISRSARLDDKVVLIIHHISIIGGSAYVIANVECVCYQVIGMIVEVNSVFLHARRLMRLSGYSRIHRVLAKLNSIANILTFIVFRLILFAWLFTRMIADGAKLPVYCISYFAAAWFVLTGSNAVLFHRLVCTDFLAGKKGNCDRISTKRNHDENENDEKHVANVATKNKRFSENVSTTYSRHDTKR